MFFINKLKAAFRRGENNKRHKVLKAIAEAMEEEYSEDNFYTRFYFLVEEMLIADPSFNKLFDKKTTSEYLKKGLADAVDNATQRLESRGV